MSPSIQTIGPLALLGWSLLAVLSFQAAQFTGIGWLIIPCAYALIEISRAATHRKVFYPLLGVGFAFYAPQLGFFWNIFGPAAMALWLVLAFWVALFGLALRAVRLRWGEAWALVLAPFVWTGLEYFRCELYYLRFGWLTFGMTSYQTPSIQPAGVFGLGFLFVAIAAGANRVFKSRKLWEIAAFVVCVGILAATLCPALMASQRRDRPGLTVAGVQLEIPTDDQVISGLKKAHKKFPDAQLFMLSEYTFQNPVPQTVRDWCASNRVYLVAGGKEPLGETNFYNTAYVVGTNGEMIFQQAKSVPIQFFKDGRPAPERKVWNSPWGKLGILICYDLSYTRVVDDFVRQGAIALLNPTMDVADWGASEHTLHSRIAPARATEYGMPIFRVCSSGISQLVSSTGRVLASAPFPGEGEIIGGRLPLDAHPRLPLDRSLAPVCVGSAALALLAPLLPARKKAACAPESMSTNLSSS